MTSSRGSIIGTMAAMAMLGASSAPGGANARSARPTPGNFIHYSPRGGKPRNVPDKQNNGHGRHFNRPPAATFLALSSSKTGRVIRLKGKMKQDFAVGKFYQAIVREGSKAERQRAARKAKINKSAARSARNMTGLVA